MKQEELLQEIKAFVESDTFKEAGGVDDEGDVDFGPASEAIKDFVDGLEEDDVEAEDNDETEG